MKKLILLLMPLIFIGWTWGETEWTKTECKICGKSICYEAPITFSGDSIASSSMSSPPQEEGFSLEGVSGLVCHDCYQKYSAAYRDWCMIFWKEKYTLNEENRKLYDAQREIDKINENNRKIRELQEEIEDLKK